MALIWSLWFQMEVLQESKMMILDSHRRLVTAHGNLFQLLVSKTRSNSVKNIFHVSTGQNCVDETLNPHFRHMVANGFHEIG